MKINAIWFIKKITFRKLDTVFYDIRFLVEEKCRRLAQKEDDIPSKRTQSDYFNGNKTEKIVSKAMEIKNLSENQKFTVEEILEKLNGEKQIDNSEELKKVEALVDDEVESQPWYNSLSNGDSKATQNLHSFNNSLGKSLNFIKVFILNLNSDAVPTPESMKDLDWFKEDIVWYAMLFQNSLHPANKMRREAIEANQYVEITDKEIAEKYLKDTYRSLLNLEISGEESRILTLQNSDMYSNISQTWLLIKDIPAFVNLIKGLKVGDGGVSNLLKSMIDNVSLNAIEKLRCIATMNFNGNTIFADEYKVRPSKLKIKSARLFNLYINYVYKAKQATDDQFKDVFQEITDEKIQKWIVTYKNILSKQGENN